MKDTNGEDSGIPDALLMKLYDATGSKNGDKGFLLFFVNSEGKVACLSKAQGQAVELGVHKCAEMFCKSNTYLESK